jgi:hypothetical protein
MLRCGDVDNGEVLIFLIPKWSLKRLEVDREVRY